MSWEEPRESWKDRAAGRSLDRAGSNPVPASLSLSTQRRGGITPLISGACGPCRAAVPDGRIDRAHHAILSSRMRGEPQQKSPIACERCAEQTRWCPPVRRRMQQMVLIAQPTLILCDDASRGPPSGPILTDYPFAAAADVDVPIGRWLRF